MKARLHAGLIADAFHFVDLYRTLETNPSERARQEEGLRGVLRGAVSLGGMLSGRLRPERVPRTKVSIATQIRFDHECSPHSNNVSFPPEVCVFSSKNVESGTAKAPPLLQSIPRK